MGQKLMRTEEELRNIVMGELRTHEECGDITGVTVRRVRGESWGVSTINHDYGSDAYQRTMEEVVAQLNVAYGLAREPRREVAR
jgi:hypothetical protein